MSVKQIALQCQCDLGHLVLIRSFINRLQYHATNSKNVWCVANVGLLFKTNWENKNFVATVR